MNITPSKIFLGLSIGGFAMVGWDHLGGARSSFEQSTDKKAAPLVIPKSVPLALACDPFGIKPLDRAVVPLLPREEGKDLADLTLQAILFAPTEKIAMVNGQPLRVGEIVKLEPNGPYVRALRVGDDFAIIEGNGQLKRLTIEAPSLKDKTEATEASGPAAPGRGGARVGMRQTFATGRE